MPSPKLQNNLPAFYLPAIHSLFCLFMSRLVFHVLFPLFMLVYWVGVTPGFCWKEWLTSVEPSQGVLRYLWFWFLEMGSISLPTFGQSSLVVPVMFSFTLLYLPFHFSGLLEEKGYKCSVCHLNGNVFVRSKKKNIFYEVKKKQHFLWSKNVHIIENLENSKERRRRKINQNSTIW